MFRLFAVMFRLFKEKSMRIHVERHRGKFRKRHEHDCGHARCWLCHGEKLAQRPRRQEIRANDTFKESVQCFTQDRHLRW